MRSVCTSTGERGNKSLLNEWLMGSDSRWERCGEVEQQRKSLSDVTPLLNARTHPWEKRTRGAEQDRGKRWGAGVEGKKERERAGQTESPLEREVKHKTEGNTILWIVVYRLNTTSVKHTPQWGERGISGRDIRSGYRGRKRCRGGCWLCLCTLRVTDASAILPAGRCCFVWRFYASVFTGPLGHLTELH